MEQLDLPNLIPNIDSVKTNQKGQILIRIRETYDRLNDQDLNVAMYKISEHIMRLKNINPQIHDFLQDCIKDVIRISVARGFAIGTQALRVIFNTQAEYYRHSKLDTDMKFPLGQRHPLQHYQPEVGQQCDIVKPYISSITYCGWTRGIIISKQANKYLVKYANCDVPSETKQKPFCAPLGTRTQDNDWRMNLSAGDQVDAFHKVWYKGTVVKQQRQNSVKRVRVTFKIYSEHGSLQDKQGNRYDGLNYDQDQWFQVTSYRIQKPGKMSKNLCLYSLNSEEFIIDDTYDLIFQKQFSQISFRGIMRSNFTKSLSFLQFYETFCDMGGNQVFMNLLDNYNKEYLQPVFNAMVFIGNSSFLVPRMRVYELFPLMVQKAVKILYDNSKALSQVRNQMSYFFIDIISKRIMSLSQKHLLFNQVRKHLALDFLNLNMEKQMTALRFLYELIAPVQRKYSQEEKIQIDIFLVTNNIFQRIVQPSTHQQILLRSIEFIKYLLTNGLISFKEIEYLWNIYPATDQRGKSTVQKMIGEISKVFSIEDTKKVIEKILAYKQSELTVDNLSLLRSLKDHKELEDIQRLAILQYLWQIITLKSMNITQVIEEQIQKVFKSIIPTIQSNIAKLDLLRLLLLRLQDLKHLNNQFQILKQFIETYPKKLATSSSDILKIQEDKDPITSNNQVSSKIPLTLSQVVQYLKQNKIYETIINIFNQLKNPQKMKNILRFTAFLFEHDKDDVDNIAKIFYDKMGPSDIFLDWAQNITQKAHQFFIYFFNSFEGISKFQNLSNSGLDALKVIIFDVNIKEGNLKIIKKYKAIGTQSDTNDKNKNSSNSVGQGKGPVYGPAVQKPDLITFLYLLKSPYECKGVKFLQELLCVVKNNKVYDQIIKLIIQFFVNLDESLSDRTKQFREQFLMEIITRFKEINERNEYNDQIKLKLEISINLLQQLFAQTQKQGLLDIKPHFQCIQGQILKLKIQNRVTSNKTEDFAVQINQNATLHSLKVKVAQIIKEKPQNLDIFKFVNPIADELNSKSLSDLHLFNQQTIKVMRKAAKDIPKKDLLNETAEQLSPKFNRIVQKWFFTYNNQQGQMGLQQLKKLSSQCWKGSSLKQVSKLNEILKMFDTNQKGYLTLQQFRQFFISKSAQNPAAIWRIINLSGYKNDLKHKDQPEEQVNSNIYPRRILSNLYVYEVIFSILSNKTFEVLHLNFYRLLSLLETDINLKEEVRKNAKNLIEDQTSVYNLSYILETVLSQIFINEEFYIQFYRIKGCEFIFHKLSNFMSEDKSIYTFDTLIKTIIMPNMVKILNAYIFCLHSENKFIRFIRKNKINQTQIDLLSSQVKKINDTSNEKNQFEQKLTVLRTIENSISDQLYHGLAEKIFFNLVAFFNTDLLQKLTNQIVRTYCTLSLSLNRINQDQIINGLKCESLNFRRSCQNLQFLYLMNNSSQVKVFLELLLANLPKDSKIIYSNFFTLLEKVLEIYLDSKKDETDDTEFIELADKLFTRLFQDLPNENRNSVVSDKLLLGVLVVINILLIKRQGVRKAFKHLKKELLEKCLFFYHPKDQILAVQITPEILKVQKQANHFKNYVKCKSEDTRKVMMQIIFHLHEVSAQQDPVFIDQYILPIFNDLPKQKRKFQTKTMQVGLSNLGSTCYLNSMLQILNSVTPFRNRVMQCTSQAPMVKQMKAMFSYLFFSQRQDYSLQELLQAFVPPILKGIQQDTTQFLNILLDQLEICLKQTAQNNLLQEIFQGTQAAQMICHACGEKRERKQTFFTYGVQIQGKYDLNSALEGMNTGQLITDCFCENCGKKADTTKRTVIDSVPNLFFIHLKRIVFNYDVFMNTKIHTRLQFPAQLNFEPYTKEGIELRERLGVQYMKNLKDNEEQKKAFQQLCKHDKIKDFYKLKLKGIIVHSGGPEVGHYWAISKKQSGWIKFDDSRVNVFPQSSMQSECYGGNFQSDQWGGMGSSTNAYVLLYEKQLKSDLVLGDNQNKRVIPFDKCETFNTEDLYKQVWLDNHSLMLQNHLLRDSFCKQFIHFLIQMLRITPSTSKIEVISETLYKVCFQSGQTGKLMDVLIENIDQIQPHVFRNYVIGQKPRTFDLLFHNNANVRDFTAVYMQKVVIQTFKKGNQQDRNEVFKLIDELLHLLHHDVAKNWLRIDGYFRFFQAIVTNSVHIKELNSYLINKHLIAYFIDFIMQKSSPINIYPKKHSIGTKSNPAHFGHAIGLIFFLIKRSFGLTGQNYEVPLINPEDLYHLSDNDILCLSHIGFYEKMLRERQNLEILGLIIQRLSIKNVLFSEAVARVMLITLNEITDAKDEMIDICSCISKYLVITDEYWQNRAEFILGYSSPYIFNDNLMTSLDQQRFVYYSTLQDLFPVQSLLAYCHINRLRNPLAVLRILKTVLQGCNVSQISKQYLLAQKSPSYHHERYLDWVRPYINSVLQTLNLSKDKKQILLKQVQICNMHIWDIEQVKRPIESLITGRIMNSNVVDRFTNQQNSIEVVISNVQTYTLNSEPTGFGNVTLDSYLDHGRMVKRTTKNSNILCFFKEFSKPLAIKQAIQQAQQKQLQSLFDDCVQKKPEQVITQNPASQKIIKQFKQKQAEQKKQNSPQKITEQLPQQIIFEQINIPGVQLSPDYFRKIQVINNSTKTKRVVIRFNTNETSNMIVPSKIYFVSSRKAVQTMWICKNDSKKGWGTVDYELIVDQKQPKSLPKWFKIYGQNQVQEPKLEPIQIQATNLEPAAYVPEKMQIQGQMQVQGMISQLECPTCTLLNLSTETNCQVCGSNLR